MMLRELIGKRAKRTKPIIRSDGRTDRSYIQCRPVLILKELKLHFETEEGHYLDKDIWDDGKWTAAETQ